VGRGLAASSQELYLTSVLSASGCSKSGLANPSPIIPPLSPTVLLHCLHAILTVWTERLVQFTINTRTHEFSCSFPMSAQDLSFKNVLQFRPIFIFKTIFGRPFVKRFALCYRTAVLSCLSVTFVHCGQTVGRIKMKLGMQVGLGPGHIVLDGDQAPPPKGHSPHPIFGPYLLRPNGCMDDQDATWYGDRSRPRRLCVR